MRINNRGLRITDIGTEGIEEITTADDGIHVRFDAYTWTWSAQEVRNLADALIAALGEDSAKTEPEVWDRIEDVPADRFPVADRDGSKWDLRMVIENGLSVNAWAPFRSC